MDEATRRVRRARRLRWSLGAIVCFLLPAASWIEGSAAFAWTMYSRAGEFRIDLVAFDADGRPHRRNPTALAEHAAPATALLLAGSDHWRPGPSMATLRRHIDDLAAYACRETLAARVEVILRERVGDRPERATTGQRACAP